MGRRKEFRLAYKKVQKIVDAMGKIARNLECFFSAGSDIYVVGDFISVNDKNMSYFPTKNYMITAYDVSLKMTARTQA